MNDFNYYLLNEETGINLNYINYAFLSLLEKDRDTFNSLSDIFKGFYKKYWYIDNTLSGYGKGNIVYKNALSKIDFLNKNNYAQTVQEYINTNIEDYEYRIPDYDGANFSIVKTYIDLMGNVYDIGDVNDLPNISISRKTNNKDSLSNSSWYDYLVTDSTILGTQDIYDPYFELSMRNHRAEYHSTWFQRLSLTDGDDESNAEAKRLYDQFLRKDLESIFRILSGLGEYSYNMVEVFKPKGDYYFDVKINSDNTMKISAWEELNDNNIYQTDSMWELSRASMVGFEKHYITIRPLLNDDNSKLYYRFTTTPHEEGNRGVLNNFISRGVKEIQSKKGNDTTELDKIGLKFLDDIGSQIPEAFTDQKLSEIYAHIDEFNAALEEQIESPDDKTVIEMMTDAQFDQVFGMDIGIPIQDIENKLWEFKATDVLADIGNLIDQTSKNILVNLPKLDPSYESETFVSQLQTFLSKTLDEQEAMKTRDEDPVSSIISKSEAVEYFRKDPSSPDWGISMVETGRKEVILDYGIYFKCKITISISANKTIADEILDENGQIASDAIPSIPEIGYSPEDSTLSVPPSEVESMMEDYKSQAADFQSKITENFENPLIQISISPATFVNPITLDQYFNDQGEIAVEEVKSLYDLVRDDVNSSVDNVVFKQIKLNEFSSSKFDLSEKPEWMVKNKKSKDEIDPPPPVFPPLIDDMNSILEIPYILDLKVPYEKVGIMHDLMNQEATEYEEVVYKICHISKNNDDVISKVYVQYWPKVAEKKGITDFKQLAGCGWATDIEPFFTDDYEIMSSPVDEESGGISPMEVYIFSLKEPSERAESTDAVVDELIDTGDWVGLGTDNDTEVFYKPYNKHRMINEFGFYQVPKFDTIYSTSMSGFDVSSYSIPGIFTPTYGVDSDKLNFVAKVPTGTKAIRMNLFGSINPEFEDISYFESDLIGYGKYEPYEIEASEGWFKMATKAKLMSIMLGNKEWLEAKLNDANLSLDDYHNGDDLTYIDSLVDMVFDNLSSCKLIQWRKLTPEYIIQEANWGDLNDWLNKVITDGFSLDGDEGFGLDIYELELSTRIKLVFFHDFLPILSKYIIWKQKYGKFIKEYMEDYLKLINLTVDDKEYFFYLAKLKHKAKALSDTELVKIYSLRQEIDEFNESYPFKDYSEFVINGSISVTNWKQFLDTWAMDYGLSECLKYANLVMDDYEKELSGSSLVSNIVFDITSKVNALKSDSTYRTKFNYYAALIISDAKREISSLVNYLYDILSKVEAVKLTEINGQLFDYQDREILEYNKIIVGLAKHYEFISKFDLDILIKQ